LKNLILSQLNKKERHLVVTLLLNNKNNKLDEIKLFKSGKTHLSHETFKKKNYMQICRHRLASLHFSLIIK